MESHETASMSPVSDDNKSRADQFLGSAQQSTDDDVLQASLTSEASSMDAVDEVSSVINDLTEDVPENNDSGDQVPDQDVIDHSGAVSFSTNQQGPVMSRKAAVPELYRLAALLGVKIELPLTLPHNPDATLMGLPAEVRIMIYELLLINPILGELASISKHDHYGAHQSYELHPAVIGVCKQVQTEATPILYGRNTFCVVCLPFPGPTWTMQEDLILSPFTRYSSYPPFPLPFSSQLPSVRDIKKWKVILSVRAWHDYESQPSCPFFEVCRAISRGHPTHVDIAIIPKGIEDGVFEYQNMEEALKPLGLLRHIENFQIRDTTPFEIPDIIDQDEDAIEFPSNMEDHAVLEVTLTLSAQSDDPVEKVFEMYGSLLRYAQSFEQLPQFKQEMALEEYCSQPAAIDFPDDSIEWDFLSEHLNPFKESGCNHPVEAALMLARTYADNEDGQQFKVERAAIIEYLEPQFQRVSAAASAVVGFVKEEKCRGGILDCCQATLSSDDEYATICATAMMLLEECDTTFRRDMSFHIKVKFRQFRSPFRRIYATTGVGHALMEDLNFALETRNYTGFVNFFKVAVDRLDNLFLEMLRARQDLFKWDVPAFNDRQCTIDPQIERSTENISWEYNEPDLIPCSFDIMSQATQVTRTRAPRMAKTTTLMMVRLLNLRMAHMKTRTPISMMVPLKKMRQAKLALPSRLVP
ncbi:hypothetical protein DL98DRAFT_42879 [Cadophora sp. DSE1049]|nr:hypothetical protein DL98DRAFT_42879 [Cadophora sp. DSE1049]